MNMIAHKDLQLFQWLFSYTHNRSMTIIRLISKTGDGYLYVAVALCLFVFAHQGADFLSVGLAAFALELPLYLILKRAFKRSRPSDVLISAHITPSDKFSLPSGHTAAACVMATLLSHFWPTWAIFVWIWAGLIGISRVLLGVHYPSDVVIGALLGITSALFSIVVFL